MKRLVFYPFLLVLNFILTPLAGNLDQLDPALAIRPLLVLWLGAGVGLVLFRLLFKDWQYAAWLVFLLALLLCGFSYLSRAVDAQLANYGKTLLAPAFLAICAGVVLLLGLKWVWVRFGGSGSLGTYLNMVTAVVLVFPAYTLISGSVFKTVQAESASSHETVQVGALELSCEHMPDIYYIVLDGYGRADALQTLFGIDSQPFLDSMEAKGFYVAAESHTNYIQTIYSLPASMNFNYITPPEEGVNKWGYFTSLMRNSEIMKVLKGCGYQTIAIESGYSFTNKIKVDIYLEQGVGANEFESLLLADSPVEVLASQFDVMVSDHGYEAHRRRVLYSFEKLATLYRMHEPTFAFAHIVSPHPPFVFDANGQPLNPNRKYYLGDGEDFQGELEEYIAGYSAQVAFVNQQVEKMVDSILAHSDTPPVIIIQGDHGPGSRLWWDFPSRSCLWERTAILNAYYLPGEGKDWLYPSISPVNTFRVVLNEYFDADLALLPDDTYFSYHKLDRPVLDITAKRDSRNNCELP